VIAGLSSDRRDPKKEPVKGWSRQPRNIVLVRFGSNLTHFAWYSRSVLGMKFGQALIEEEIDDYRVDSGEHDLDQSTLDVANSGNPCQSRNRPPAESITDAVMIAARVKALEAWWNPS
jgi:hypothetical protein